MDPSVLRPDLSVVSFSVNPEQEGQTPLLIGGTLNRDQARMEGGGRDSNKTWLLISARQTDSVYRPEKTWNPPTGQQKVDVCMSEWAGGLWGGGLCWRERLRSVPGLLRWLSALGRREPGSGR